MAMAAGGGGIDVGEGMIQPGCGVTPGPFCVQMAIAEAKGKDRPVYLDDNSGKLTCVELSG